MEKSRFACMQKPKQAGKPKNNKTKQKAKNTRFKSEDFLSDNNVFKKANGSKDNVKDKGKETKPDASPSTGREDKEKRQKTHLRLSSVPLKLDITALSFPNLLEDVDTKKEVQVACTMNYSKMVKKTEPKKIDKTDTKMLDLSDKERVRRWLINYKNERRRSDYLEEEDKCDLIWANWQIHYQADKRQREELGEKFYEVTEEDNDYDSDTSSDDEFDEREPYDDN
tara:strand:+ start:1188 stop:1862 length:675 start_codon:yes stop_codon:yes gene_type:complete